jgi:hypothetical protein
MDAGWAALLGAIVGGLFTLAGAVVVELRRDRRRQIGAARMVIAEIDRARIELMVHEEDEGPWVEGPHPEITSQAWQTNAAEFVGELSERDFKTVDGLADELRRAGDWGFTMRSMPGTLEKAEAATDILRPLTQPTWWDRYVWRL